MTQKSILIIIFLYLFISKTSTLATVKESGGKATIKATIPAYAEIRLFGYTAPYALVQVEGIRTFAQVSSDKDGYFLIDPLPVASEAKEICLTTIDSQKRMGFPVCYPAPATHQEIGPILLSPILSLSKGILWQNEKGKAEGVTLPNTKVVISFFEIPKNSFFGKFPLDNLALIPEVEAANPQVYGFSDKRGNFSINLPTNKSSSYRLFAKAYFQDAPTNKSASLVFSVEPLSKIWLTQILPRLLFFFFFLLFLLFLANQERKKKKAAAFFTYLIEKKLKPFGVRRRLQLRRIWYNLREYWRSNRI